MNSKRFLIFILTLVIAFSFAVVPSYAEDTVTNDIDYPGEAISLLSSLNLINRSDYEQAGQTFTRRDLAERLVTVINMKNFEFDGAISFTDVDYYDLSYSAIGICTEQGLMNGVSTSEFAPSRECTATEVVVTLMRALGYKHIAESKGGFAYGYLAQANSVGLLDGIDSSLIGGPCTNRMFAQMFYNMLEVEVYEINGIIDGEPLIERGDAYMSEIFGIESDEGIITANSLTSVDSGDGADSGYMYIDGVRYKTAVSELDKYLGYSVEYYYRDLQSGVDELLYAVPSNSNYVTVIDSSNIDSTSGNFITYFDGDKTKTLTIPKTADWLYNNQPENPVDYSVLDMKNDGRVILISNDGDKSADVVMIEEYTNIYVGAINRNTGDIYDEYSASNRLHIDLDSVGEGVYIYNSNRELMDFDAIEEGSMLSCLVSKNGKVVVIYDTVKEVIGTVSEAELQDNVYKSVVINDTKYEVASNLRDYMDDIVIGSSNIIGYLDINGKLAGYKGITADQYTYAYLKGVMTEGTFDKTIMLNLYEAGSPRGEFKVFSCGKSITVDDIDYKTNEANIEATFNKLSSVTNQLIAIKTDASGRLLAIKTIEGGGIQLVGKQTNSYYVADSPSGLLGSMPIPSDAQVIYIPEDGLEKNFYTGGKDDFVHDKQYASVTGYKIEDERIAPDILVMSAPTGAAALSGSVDCIIVTDVSRSVIDESGTEGTKISGFRDGVKGEFYMEDSVECLSLQNDVLKLREGDVMRAAVDSLGNISAVQVLYRADEDKMYADKSPNVSWSESPRIYKAWVYKQHSSHVIFSMMHPDSPDYDNTTETRNISTRTEIYVYDSKKPDGSKISLGSAKDLLAYYDLGGSCSKVFCHTRGALLELTMVIK